MLRTIGRRLLFLIPTLFGLSILLFAWVRALPGGPAVALLGEKATPEAVARVNELYGFDKPLIEQYFIWIGRLLQGDFGTSIQTNRPVTEEFLRRFPATLELSVMALIFAVGIGIPLGYWAARRHGKFTDHASVVLSLIGITIPVFFLAFILKYVFAVQLGWLPSDGRQNPRIDATHPTGFYVWDGIITGEFDAAWDAILHLILPALALGTIPLAIIVRITRASVLEVQNADYVRTGSGEGRRVADAAQPLHPAKRHAPGDHHDRPADGAADLGGGAHRDGVRLPGHRLVPGESHLHQGLPRPPRVHHLHRDRLRVDQPGGGRLLQLHRSESEGAVMSLPTVRKEAVV